ncbi:hypothetical protein LguiA_007668 [Lonicera macranthoides]
MSGKSNYATLWLALSGSARSNGVLNAGYICFQTMHRAYDAVFINKRYYGSRVFKIFPAKQLPNFLLAFPILSLAVCSIIYYAKLRREVFLSLGFQASPVDKKSAAVFFSVGEESRSKSEFVLEKETTKIREGINLKYSCFPS